MLDATDTTSVEGCAATRVLNAVSTAMPTTDACTHLVMSRDADAALMTISGFAQRRRRSSGARAIITSVDLITASA